MRIGIFGGTFDPPHVGHLILAAEMCSQINLDRMLWVLTPDPPHKLQKKPVADINSRCEMVLAAIKNNPVFMLSTVEIDRPGPHFSVDTMRILTTENPRDHLFFMIGGDSLRDLPTWYQPQELIRLCAGFGVMRRPEDAINLQELERVLPGITEKVFFIETPLLQISSSEIRSRIQNGGHFRYYLPDPVYQLIIQNHWYGYIKHPDYKCGIH